VADIERSKAFFARLGFSYNPMFTDETAACMLVGWADRARPNRQSERPAFRAVGDVQPVGGPPEMQ